MYYRDHCIKNKNLHNDQLREKKYDKIDVGYYSMRAALTYNYLHELIDSEENDWMFVQF